MPNPNAAARGRAASLQKGVLLASLIVLIIGVVGYFSLPRGTISMYVFAHIGALGLLGLIGGGVGALAQKKGRSYTTALLLGGALPIAVGLIAVAMVRGQTPCGGSVSLAVALLVAVAYVSAKKRTLPQP